MLEYITNERQEIKPGDILMELPLEGNTYRFHSLILLKPVYVKCGRLGITDMRMLPGTKDIVEVFIELSAYYEIIDSKEETVRLACSLIQLQPDVDPRESVYANITAPFLKINEFLEWKRVESAETISNMGVRLRRTEPDVDDILESLNDATESLDEYIHDLILLSQFHLTISQVLFSLHKDHKYRLPDDMIEYKGD